MLLNVKWIYLESTIIEHHNYVSAHHYCIHFTYLPNKKH